MIRRLVIIAASVLLLANSAFAADATLGVDFSTSYIFRGVAVNDRAVAQPHLEVGGFPKIEGLTLGAWGNLNMGSDSSDTPSNGGFNEVDLTVDYALPLGLEVLGMSVGYIEYLYPGSDTGADADRELYLMTELDTILNPYFGVYVGLDNATEKQVYMELGVGHEEVLDECWSLDFGGALAWLIQADDVDADDGLSYATLSAAVSYDIFTLGIATFIETDDDVTEVDEEVQGTFGVALDF